MAEKYTLEQLMQMGAQPVETPPAPPTVGGWETYFLRGSQALPAGGLLADLISTALVEAGKRGMLPGGRDVEGERATLTPEAQAELEAGGGQVAEPEGAVDTYRDIRGTRRLRTAAGSEQNPGAARLGTATGIAASIAAPLPKVTVGSGRAGRIGSAALTGGAYGALNGATEGEADLTMGDVPGVLRDTATGAVVGTLTGGVLGGAVEMARPLAGALRRFATEQARRTIQGGTDVMAGSRVPLSSEAADEILTSGAVQPFSTTQATAGRIEALASERGAVYGKILEELEQQGVQGPNAKALADQIYRRYLEEYPNYVSSKAIPEIFKKVSENVDEAALPGPPGVVEGPARLRLGLRQTEAIKQDLQDVAKFERLNANPSNETYRELSSTVRQANEDAILEAARAAPAGSRLRALAESFKPVKEQLARTLEARHFSRPGASKAQQRNPTNLKDLAVGMTASGGEPLSGLALTQLASVGRNRLPSTLAAGSFNLSEGLRTGSMAGDIAATLGGSAELARDEVQSRADRATIDERTDPLTAALIRALRTKPKKDNPSKEQR